MNEILEAMENINPVQCDRCKRIIYVMGHDRSHYVCVDCMKGV